MKVVTRFAPTISGDLHLGSLYNALLNYLYAKKAGGEFKLRVDSTVLTEQRKQWQDGIFQDLNTFGLIPDQILKASDRLDLYREQGRKLLENNPRSYHCDCSVQDLLTRARQDDSNFYHLYRPEKYPPYCRVCQIKILDAENGLNVGAGKSVKASMSASGSNPNVLTCKTAKQNIFWEPWESGYQFHPVQPTLTVDLGSKTKVSGVEIVWKDRSALKYAVDVVCDGKTTRVAECTKFGKYFVDVKPGQAHTSLTSDTVSFAHVEAEQVIVTMLELPRPVDRPYFYDYDCRDKNKQLDLMSRNATARLEHKPWYVDGEYSGPRCFVTGQPTIFEDDPKVDTCWWFGRESDLVFTSPYDDNELGATHLIRGNDIRAFCVIESQVADAIGMMVPNQTYHGLILNEHGYKYSKFIESTPIRDYLVDGITPEMVITYLAHATKIIDELPPQPLTLDQLVDRFDTDKIALHHTTIVEQEMLDSIKSTYRRVSDGQYANK